MVFFFIKNVWKIKLFFFLEHPSGVKRVKRTLSPTTSTGIFINGDNDDNSEDNDEDDDEDDDDERDSSSNPTTMSPRTILTCPTCGSTYHRLGHLIRHAKRKHHIDLSNYDGPYTFDMLTTQTNQIETSNIESNKNSTEQIVAKTEDLNSTKKSLQKSSKFN